MTLPRGAALVLAVAGLAALPVAAGATGGSGATKKVQVGDDYYGPTKLTVKKNTTIKWLWIEDNTNSHDVKLSSGPKGVKKFHSESAASDYTFSEKLKAAGTYKIVCTLHQDMTMKIVVK
jgi:plastocyanin